MRAAAVRIEHGARTIIAISPPDAARQACRGGPCGSSEASLEAAIGRFAL